MKILLTLAAVVSLLGTGSALAGTVSCSDMTPLPTQFVSGNCENGFCTANVPAASITVDGSCSGSVTFNASAFTSGGFLNANCQNGFLSGSTEGGYLNFSGTCSNGGSFSGSAYASSSFFNGTCQKNGFFSITLNPGEVEVQGNCD